MPCSIERRLTVSTSVIFELKAFSYISSINMLCNHRDSAFLVVGNQSNGVVVLSLK